MEELSLEELYDTRLSGKKFSVQVKEIGGNLMKTIFLAFDPGNRDHLIGKGTSWEQEKRKAFVNLTRFAETANMVGDYNSNSGEFNRPDVLIGTQHGCFGFLQCDDNVYRPITCLNTDMRDRCYKPMYKIESIKEI